MTIPSHCLDESQPIGTQIQAIKDAYDDALIKSHSIRDVDDWKEANDDAGLTGTRLELPRPDDGNPLINSYFYRGTSVGTSAYAVDFKEPFFSLISIQDRLKKVQKDNDTLGLGLGNLGDLNLTELKDLVSTPAIDLLDPARIAAAPALVYDVEALLRTIGKIIDLSINLPCPADVQVYVEQIYIDTFAQLFEEYIIANEIEKLIAAGMPGPGPGGFPPGAPIVIAAKEAVQQIVNKLRFKLTSDFIAETRLLKEQCFILSQINRLVKYKRNNFVNRLPYIGTTRLVSQQSSKGTAGGVASSTSRTLETVEIPVKPSNAPILMQGDPFAFMNKMIQYPSTHQLFNLTTAQISSLVPTIRLYKILTNPETGDDIGEVEITFDTNPAVKGYEVSSGASRRKPTITKRASALDLFRNKGKRGYGVGLENFDFTFHGSDPFAVKKAIKAKLSIFATSFGDLIQERGGYKYADLALKTGKTSSDLKKNLTKIQQQNLDKLNFRLKAVVGWAIPQTEVGVFSASEKDAVYDSFVTLNLTPTIHEFNFDETGGVSFVINYLAYVEDYFNQSTFNVFSDVEVERTRIARKLFFEFLDTQGCDETSLKVIKEASASVMEQEKSKSFSSILKKMRQYDRILMYNISDIEIDEFLKTGTLADKSKLEPSTLSNANQKAILELFKTFNSSLSTPDRRRSIINLTKTSREQNIISFFYISDLLDIIMENIDETLEKLTSETEVGGINYLELLESSGFVFNDSELASRVQGAINVSKSEYKPFMNGEQVREFKKSMIRAKKEFKKLRIVLGPVEIVDPFDRKERIFCSIGDLPLSLNYFTEFLTQKMLSKEEVYYPITNFVKDLVNEVIKNFLNNDSCFDFSVRQKLKLNSATVTGHNFYKHNTDDITYAIIKGKKGSPIIRTSGPERSPVYLPDPKKEINYYIFYAGRSYPLEFMSGNKFIDTTNGIFHYVLGKDRGIVKNITLDKTDMKGLKELRFEKEGFDGLTQLREVYNANIDCFLNVQAYPGMYIYVDPRGFSPEAGINYSQFGIGGYYMITRAEHSIGAGKADTKITAKWVADTNGRVDGSGTLDNSKVVEESQLTKSRKCLTKVRRKSFQQSLSENFTINSVFDLYKLTPLGAAATLGQAIADTDE